MPDEFSPDSLPTADPPASSPPPAGQGPPEEAAPTWSVRERRAPQLRTWDDPQVPSAPLTILPVTIWPALGVPTAPPPPGVTPSVTPPANGAPPPPPPLSIHGAPPARPPSTGAPVAPPQSQPTAGPSRFPTTMQLLAVAIAAAVLVAGVGIYVFRSHGAATAPSAVVRGDAIAVVRDGPAVLMSQSLTGGAAGKSMNIPGSPDTIVTTPDGTRSFLLDTAHGQVIPVDLVHRTVGAPIPAGKLPTDEQMSRDGATLYVTDNLSGTVIPIDTVSGTPGPAQQLAQGVAAFVPAPTGSTAVVSFAGAAGDPGILAFYSPTTGLAAAVQVGLNSPIEVFYSPDGATVWVTEAGVGNLPGVVIPVDIRTHAVGKPIAVGHGTAGSAMTADGRTLLVTNLLDRTVNVIDLVARSVVATIPVGAGPERVEISADGSTAWIACVLDRTLVPIDLRTNRAGTPLPLANAPADLSIPKGSSAAWVLFPSSAGNVTFLSGSSLGHSTQVGNAPTLVIAHDSTSAWVANSLSDTVQRVDMSGGMSGSPIRVPRNPDEIALTRDQRTLLVVSFGDGNHAGYLTAIDTASSRAGTPLDVGVAPSSLTLAPDGATAYVANHQANSIVTVDLKSWRVGARIALPCSPTQLVTTPDGATLYVDCEASSEVLPITTSGHAVGAPIAVDSRSSLAMGNQGKTIFVNTAHAIQEIDVATDKVVLSHDETGNVVGIVPTLDDSSLIAVENTGGAVLILHSANLSTTTSISVGSRPGGLQLTPDGSRAYVLDDSQQKLYVIDLVAAKVTATIDVSPNASYVAVPSRQP